MEAIKRGRTLCDETAEKPDRYVESASEQQIAENSMDHPAPN
jgi:hypothetical protein